MSRHLSLRPRLLQAAMLGGRGVTAADIGCDHGQLAASLAQQGAFQSVIGVDISAASLKKCAALAARLHLEQQIRTRVGDGLNALSPGEADVIFILGMGDGLILRILSDAPVALMGASRAVLSPMRGAEELRRWLYWSGYHIISDRIVPEGGRCYQVFAITPPDDNGRDPLPKGWPVDCFEVGYRAYLERDPLLTSWVEERLKAHEKRLLSAQGTAGGPALLKKCELLRSVIKLMEVRR